MIEIIMVLIIMGVLVALIASQVVGRIGQSRSAALAGTLNTMSDAIQEYRADVRRYPTHLRYLATAPTTGVADLCSRTLPASYLSAWRGPYLKSDVETTGFVIGESTVQNTLELDPVGPYTVTTTGALVIVTLNVDSAVAAELEARFDGNNNLSTGTIRFAQLSGREGTLRFALPVRGC